MTHGIPPADEVFLSGSTPLIELEQLAPKEAVNIGTNPLISTQFTGKQPRPLPI
jgi:hypothetical protein